MDAEATPVVTKSKGKQSSEWILILFVKRASKNPFYHKDQTFPNESERGQESLSSFVSFINL